ncbi:hypothetical protein Esti_000704 [Eimeria stiedai]
MAKKNAKQKQHPPAAAAAAADSAAEKAAGAAAAKAPLPAAAAAAAGAGAGKQGKVKRLDRRFDAARDPRFLINSAARKQQQQHRELQQQQQQPQQHTAGTSGRGPLCLKRLGKVEEAQALEERAHKLEAGAATAATAGGAAAAAAAAAAAEAAAGPLQLDSRFARILTEPRFLTGRGFQGSSKTDKYGRQQQQQQKSKKKRKGSLEGAPGGPPNALPSEQLAARVARKELLQLYTLEETQETNGSGTEPSAAAAATAGAEGSSSSSSSSESESSGEEEDERDGDVWNTVADAPMSEAVSSRLAVMGLDWDSVKAVDLLLLMQQFAAQGSAGKAPSGGPLTPGAGGFQEEGGPAVKRVQIFLSDFGKQRIEQERIEGPAVDWSLAEKKRSKARRGDKAKRRGDASGVSEDEQQASPEEEKALHEAFRKYQVERSRYHYAIVELDSAATATRVYTELDGCDFGFALNGLDLRFVPKNMELPEANLVAAADSSSLTAAAAAAAAERLQQAAAHSSGALKNCQVKLTWDETPKERTKFLRRKFTAEELREQDLEAFLASSSGSEFEEKEGEKKACPGKGKNKEAPKKRWRITEDNIASFRQQLLGVFACSGFGAFVPDHAAGELAVNFKDSLEALVSDSPDEASDFGENGGLFHSSSKKKKEKQLRKAKGRRLSPPGAFKDEESEKTKKPTDKPADAAFVSDDEVGANAHACTHACMVEGWSWNGGGVLCVCVVCGQDELRHFDFREGRRRKKNKEKKGGEEMQETQPGFKLDVADPRFSRVLESHHFALDPTNPAFKDSDSTRELMRKRRDHSHKHKFKKTATQQQQQPQEQQQEQQHKKETLRGLRLV